MKAGSDRDFGFETSQAVAAEAARERILIALGLTRRPLRSVELARALGLGIRQSGTACRWLADNGLIELSGESEADPQAGWSLSGQRQPL